MHADTLVVGGGVMGLSVALHVAQRKDPIHEPVVLLERKELGAGSSGRSGAILRQHYADPVVARMARDSLREYASFEARTGRPVGFRRTGVLTLAGPNQPDWADRIRGNVAMLQELGIETELVEDAQLAELVPDIAFRPGTVGAWEPDGGVVDPGLVIESFAALARANGAVTRLNCPAQEIRVEDGRVVGVSTPEGEYRANRVCIVAGPWTGGLLARLGVELPLRVVCPENHFVRMPDSAEVDGDEEEEEDVRRGSLSFDDVQDPVELAADAESDARTMRGIHPVLIDLENDMYVRCEVEHRRTRVGRTDYDRDRVLEDPDALDEEVSPEFVTWAREALSRRLPSYADQPDSGSLAAWYTLTPDAQAILGPVPGIEGLFVVSGFSGHGFKLAPTVGQGIAEMLDGERVTAFDAEFFAPGRFGDAVGWEGRFGL